MKLAHTPWGHPQDQKIIADGIVSISTARHGGYWLNPARWELLIAILPGFKPYAGPQWLEEDCDWCAAPLAFPEAFNYEPQTLFNAWNTLKYSHFHVAEHYATTQTGKRVIAIAEQFAESVADKWERGGCGTSGGKGVWWVFLHRGDELATAEFADYPGEQFYTDAQLAALTVAPLKISQRKEAA